MKPPRLAELQRQRDLVRQHLAWLDREIAASLGPAAGQTPPPPAGLADASEPTASPAAAAVQPDPASAAASARRGCFLFAVIVALVFAGVLAGVYFVKYRDRPLFFAEQPHEPAPAR